MATKRLLRIAPEDLEPESTLLLRSLTGADVCEWFVDSPSVAGHPGLTVRNTSALTDEPVLTIVLKSLSASQHTLSSVIVYRKFRAGLYAGIVRAKVLHAESDELSHRAKRSKGQTLTNQCNGLQNYASWDRARRPTVKFLASGLPAFCIVENRRTKQAWLDTLERANDRWRNEIDIVKLVRRYCASPALLSRIAPTSAAAWHLSGGQLRMRPAGTTFKELTTPLHQVLDL